MYRPAELSRVAKKLFAKKIFSSRISRIAMTIAALTPGVGHAAPTPALPHLASLLHSHKHHVRIVAFGSSSTQGIGASSPSAAYPARLEATLSDRLGSAADVEVVNRGVGGEDIDDMLARLQKDVLDRKPDMVIWQIGSNDPLRHVPLDRFDEETRKGIGEMRAAGVDVMLMEPQWCPTLEHTAGADTYRDVVRKIGDDLHVPVIRRSELMHAWIRDGKLAREQMLSADGLHMADGGYALLASEVASEILTGANQGRPDKNIVASVGLAK